VPLSSAWPECQTKAEKDGFQPLRPGASLFLLSSIEQLSAAQDTVSGAIPDARPYPSLQTAKLKRTLLAGLAEQTCHTNSNAVAGSPDPKQPVELTRTLIFQWASSIGI